MQNNNFSFFFIYNSNIFFNKKYNNYFNKSNSIFLNKQFWQYFYNYFRLNFHINLNNYTLRRKFFKKKFVYLRYEGNQFDDYLRDDFKNEIKQFDFILRKNKGVSFLISHSKRGLTLGYSKFMPYSGDINNFFLLSNHFFIEYLLVYFKHSGYYLDIFPKDNPYSSASIFPINLYDLNINKSVIDINFFNTNTITLFSLSDSTVFL